MKHKLMLIVGLSLVTLLIVGVVIAGSPLGSGFTYQGFLKESGNPAEGVYDFEFRLYDAETAGVQVGSSVALDDVTVTNGLFVVQLDFGADAFTGDARWLDIGVRPGAETGAYTALTLRQALTPAPYALHARDAWAVTGNAGTDTAANFIGTTDAQPLVLRTANTERLRVDANGMVGLGTAAPTERLTVQGNAQVLGYDDPVARGFITTTTPHAPRAVAVFGQYAYVVSESGDSLSIFDISSPDAITARGVITTGLDIARGVAVAGDYAYVASYWNKRLVVFDVSDPDSIVWMGDAYVYGPMAVTVSGRYAYVVTYSNYLVIFDISDPTNPISAGAITSNMNRPTSVFVSGCYAYVTNYYSPYLSIFDISDPGNIVPRGYTDTSLYVPYAVVVSGRYAYVASWWNGRLVTFDISDPDNPVFLDDINTNLGGAFSVAVAGRYAYVTSRNNDGLAVFDVSDPTNLVALGFTSTNLDDPQSVFVAGRYAYVASAANNRLAVFDLNHLEAPTADIGSLHTGGLHVGESAIVGNNLTVQDSLNVGEGGALINGDVSVQGDLFAHVSVTTVTGDTTLATAQSGVVLVNNAAAAIITLPDAASSTGLTFTIKRLIANVVTVASAGGTIDGAATQALAAQYDFITVISDGANWYVTGR